jgi:hypothetical protein
MDDGIDFADIGEELVAETLTLGGATHQAGDIDEFQAGGNDFDRLPISASTSRRLSGTATRPTFGSMVQNG